MQRCEVDCSTGDTRYVDLSPEEEAAVLAQQEAAVRVQVAQQQAEQEAAQRRADAVKAILSAPEIAGNSALQGALAQILGA